MPPESTLKQILTATSDANLCFTDLMQLLEALGFSLRIRGDHHIFTKQGVSEIINLQPQRGMAKVYQVRQVRRLILRYNLGGDLDA